MGIPTVFIHLPSNVRKSIRDDPLVSRAWAEVIVNIYNNVVKVGWANKVTKL